MCRITRSVLVLAALQALAPAARAQNVIPWGFEFSFSNPGARSMGLGGAFAALADDATAAFANPAGLIQIVEPEVSLEGRIWSYSTPYVAGGRIFGEPTGIGLDNTPGLRQAESSADLSGLSFLSIVYPKGRWSLAFYRHQLANFESSGAIHGLYSGPWPGVATVRREYDQRRATDLEIIGYGLAGAYRVNDDLSLGLGLTYFEGVLSSVAATHALNLDEVGPEEFFSPTPLIPETLVYSLSLDIDDTGWGLAAGVLWRIDRRWRVGGFFRQGPELECASGFTNGPANRVGAPPGESAVILTQPMAFPDVYGLGLAYRTLDERLTLAFEWDRVGYSSIVDYFGGLGSGNELEDGDELHLGAEYVFFQAQRTIALRAGAWLDPAHRIHDEEHYVTRAILPPGEDELHVAVGLGAAFKRFQIDVGLDLSDVVDTASVSTIYSF